MPLGYGGAGGGKLHLQSRHVDIDGRIFANGMAPDSRADMAAGMLYELWHVISKNVAF